MKLEPRHSVLEWALQSSRGELSGTDWVDAELRSDGEPWMLRRDGETVRFRHLPPADRLPSPMQESAADAQERGEPTVAEFLTRMIARSQWLTSARRYLWTPFSPVPQLLAPLVEAYGIDAELHDRDSATLANLLVHLPAWHPRRGEAQAAVDLLGVAMDSEVPVRLGSDAPAAFTCQSADWWSRRNRPSSWVLRDDLMTGEPIDDPEDVILGWTPTDRFPHELLRLLPVFTSVRLAPETS